MTIDASNVEVTTSGGTPDNTAIINQFLSVAQTLPQGGLGQAMRLGAAITAEHVALAEGVGDPTVVAQVVSDAANTAAG